MFSLAHLRTIFTASFVALAIAACGGSSGSSGAAASSSSLSAEEEERILESSGFSSAELEILTIELYEKADGYPHGTHIPVSTIPASGELMINVVFSKRPTSVNFSVVSVDGIELSQIIPDEQANLYDESYYYGYFNVPSEDFKIRVEGITVDGSFSYDISKIYSS